LIGKHLVYVCIALTIIVISIYIFWDVNLNNNCSSDNEKFTITGTVKEINHYGGTVSIDFEDGRGLGIQGSPENFISIDDIYNILAVGVNYTFYCHYECVMSDGNEPSWFEGTVCDKIVVN